MDSPKKLGSAIEFDGIIQSLLEKKDLTSLDNERRAKLIMNYRDGYIAATQIEDERELSGINNLAKAYFDYIKAGRVQPTEEDIKKLGVTLPDLTALPTDEALARLEETKNLVNQKLTETFDPILQEDYGFYLEQFFNEHERDIRGRNTGAFSDKVCRVAQGFTEGVLDVIGQGELADEVGVKFFPENPKFDGKFASIIANPFWTETRVVIGTEKTSIGSPLSRFESSLAKGLSAVIVIAVVYVVLTVAFRANSKNLDLGDPGTET